MMLIIEHLENLACLSNKGKIILPQCQDNPHFGLLILSLIFSLHIFRIIENYKDKFVLLKLSL